MENYQVFLALFLLVCSVSLYIAASKIRGILTIHLPPQRGEREDEIAAVRICMFLSIACGVASFFICNSIGRIPTNHLVVCFGSLFGIFHIVFHDLVFEN
ncbi:MAG: hypothetical protein ACOYMZ_02895 [Minisyncoccia bacterium]